MAIFKRGKIYWMEFVFKGERIRKSTGVSNKNTAGEIERAYRTRLAKGEVGIEEKEPAPKLKDFAPRFREAIAIRSADKPETVRFYNSKLDRLLEYEPLASAKIDRIDEGLIERYVRARRNTIIGKGESKRNLSPASVNRELATLRRMLYLAKEWKLIATVPNFKLLAGERSREFVLSQQQERDYLDFSPQPLKDAALLILDTGLRIGEAVALKWLDVHLEPIGAAKYGFLRVHKGKSKNARRIVSLTARVREMLIARQYQINSEYIFPSETEGTFLATSFNHQHARVRRLLGLSEEFVIHSLRHTMLTRLGEAGVDAFTIMKIAGHSSITVSQRYVHPSSEALERAFERLEAYNAGGREAVPTNLPTVEFPDESEISVSIS